MINWLIFVHSMNSSYSITGTARWRKWSIMSRSHGMRVFSSSDSAFSPIQLRAQRSQWYWRTKGGRTRIQRKRGFPPVRGAVFKARTRLAIRIRTSRRKLQPSPMLISNIKYLTCCPSSQIGIRSVAVWASDDKMSDIKNIIPNTL